MLNDYREPSSNRTGLIAGGVSLVLLGVFGFAVVGGERDRSPERPAATTTAAERSPESTRPGPLEATAPIAHEPAPAPPALPAAPSIEVAEFDPESTWDGPTLPEASPLSADGGQGGAGLPTHDSGDHRHEPMSGACDGATTHLIDGRYTVVAGDSLWGIAACLYDDGTRANALYEANRGILRDPARILPGQVLLLP